MTTASQFRDAFLAEYDNTWKNLIGNGRWNVVWHNMREWSDLMIYDCSGKEASVITAVAKKLCLHRCSGEPLHLDAVFCRDSQRRFPFLCIVEVENDPRSFYEEIEKLLTIRCPLKVGITYILKDHYGRESARQELKDKILSDLQKRISEANDASFESPLTEYLFLLGEEISKCELTWSYLQFTAGDATKGISDFKPAPACS